MAITSETELYGPVKRFLEAQEYEVKAEVTGCDLVAMKDGETVVVELKPAFNLALVFQVIDRQRIAGNVYAAIEAPGRRFGSRWTDVLALCRRLSVGLITVDFRNDPPAVHVECEPGSGEPRPNKKRQARLRNEFERRTGDHNVGGSTRRPLVTAYREQVLRVAWHLKQNGPGTPAGIRDALGNPRVPAMLQRNVYKWFSRIETGLYQLSSAGEDALTRYTCVLGAHRVAEETAVMEVTETRTTRPEGRAKKKPRKGGTKPEG